MLKSARLHSIRRVLAVDAGSRRLKLALVQSNFGRPQILRQEAVDLHEEGLVTAEELQNHLQLIRETWGEPPVALTLPAQLSTSHLIDLPLATEEEVRELIEAEAVKLTGVSESAIVHDFIPAATNAPDRHQFWVSLAKESDIETAITQLGLDTAHLCEVCPAANSLIAAYRATAPTSGQVILVHFGAQQTLLVIMDQAQAVYAGSFAFGSDDFTRALARTRQCPLAEAESLKQATETLRGPTALPEMRAVVNEWAAEVRRNIASALAQRPHPRHESPAFTYMASGAGFSQPGLCEFLNAEANLPLQPWPTRADLPAAGFELAFGSALQALGLTAQPISLLPASRRKQWRQHLTTQKIAVANNLLLAVCFLVLGVGLWLKFSQVRQQKALLTKVQAATEMWRTNQTLTAQLQASYETLRPLLQQRQNTRDLLETLALLEQTRSNRSFWFVLVADQQSYFQPTNSPATNGPGAFGPAYGPWPLEMVAAPTGPTNSSPAKPGLIAELCVPEGVDDARKVLSSIVNDLKPRPLFAKVDLLSDDLRQNLADAKVIVPQRHFALSLNFAATDFQPAKPAARSRHSDGSNSRNGRRNNETGAAPKPTATR